MRLCRKTSGSGRVGNDSAIPERDPLHQDMSPLATDRRPRPRSRHWCYPTARKKAMFTGRGRRRLPSRPPPRLPPRLRRTHRGSAASQLANHCRRIAQHLLRGGKHATVGFLFLRGEGARPASRGFRHTKLCHIKAVNGCFHDTTISMLAFLGGHSVSRKDSGIDHDIRRA